MKLRRVYRFISFQSSLRGEGDSGEPYNPRGEQIDVSFPTTVRRAGYWLAGDDRPRGQQTPQIPQIPASDFRETTSLATFPAPEDGRIRLNAYPGRHWQVAQVAGRISSALPWRGRHVIFATGATDEPFKAMTPFINRRRFLRTTATVSALSGLGELGFLSRLCPVSAGEADLNPEVVRFNPEIEPLVRFWGEHPRERVL